MMHEEIGEKGGAHFGILNKHDFKRQPNNKSELAAYAFKRGCYSDSELSLVPQTALRLTSGCDNPIGFAALQPGCSVVDLGCGGGTDVILAAHKVGEKGRVLGIDIAQEMIENAKQAVAEAGLQERSIFFRTADIEDFYLPANFANVLISNCVLNQCRDKVSVYRKIFRILRPSGTIYISDIVLTEELDSDLQERFQANRTGCLGGALTEEDHVHILKKLCFLNIQVLGRYFLTTEELQTAASYPGGGSSALSQEDLLLLQGKVASITITAMRPPHT